jgi:hypothetical protein
MAWLGKHPINTTFRVTASFQDASGPVTGATPKISIYNPSGSLVINAQNMTERGLGIYYYDYPITVAGIFKVHTALAASDLWGYGSFEGVDIGRMD